MPKLELTQKSIDKLELPASGAGGATRQVIYYDTRTPGLAVRVTSGGSRVYIVEGWPGGRTVRVKLARCSDWSLKRAREAAKERIGDIAAGINPNQEKRLARARSVTLAEAFEDYLATRKGARRITAHTEYDYRRIVFGAPVKGGGRKFNGPLSPWRALPLTSISAEMVARRHAELARESGSQANYSMRVLSAVFNFARAKYRGADAKLIGENPVRILSDIKAWVRVSRRTTALRAHELADWFKAVLALPEEATIARAYLQFLLLHGLRRGEAARLRWRDVDLKGQTFTLIDPKNHVDHQLPLSDYSWELLEDLPHTSEYVFPGPGKAGHLVDPKRQVERVAAAAGVTFMLHDLRRTFATIAESLDIQAYTLKRLLNHKMANDVTAGYIVSDVERLRPPTQRVTDFILRAAGVRPSAEAIELQRRAA